MSNPTERRETAVRLATALDYVTARQLAIECHVTIETARRDLAALTRRGELQKQNWLGGTFYTRTNEQRTDG